MEVLPGADLGPEQVPGWSGSMYTKGGWAEREHGRSTHPDGRVRRRIAGMGGARIRHPGKHLPAIFPGRAQQAAAWRLLSGEAVTMEHMPDSHFEQTVERCRAERLVPAMQDTTTLNHDGLSRTSGRGGPGGGGKGSSGILAHVGVAVNAVGRHPGMFEADAQFRRAEGRDSIRRLTGLDRAQELARLPGHPGGDGLRGRGRLPGADLARRGDRGGAAGPGLARLEAPGGAGLGRRRGPPGPRPGDGTGGRAEDRDSRPRRAEPARPALRCAPVDLMPPQDRAGEAPVRMTAVSALEENPPRRLAAGKGKKGNGPLHRMLPTTEGRAGLDTARMAVR